MPVLQKSMLIILAVLSALLFTAADWPQFRRPNASGVAGDTNLPTAFGPATNVVWKTAVPRGPSSQSVAGDKTFLTAFEKEDLFTIALDRTTGRILWRHKIKRRAHASRSASVRPTAQPPEVRSATAAT